jgi:hypothetical protein
MENDLNNTQENVLSQQNTNPETPKSPEIDTKIYDDYLTKGKAIGAKGKEESLRAKGLLLDPEKEVKITKEMYEKYIKDQKTAEDITEVPETPRKKEEYEKVLEKKDLIFKQKEKEYQEKMEQYEKELKKVQEEQIRKDKITTVREGFSKLGLRMIDDDISDFYIRKIADEISFDEKGNIIFEDEDGVPKVTAEKGLMTLQQRIQDLYSEKSVLFQKPSQSVGIGSNSFSTKRKGEYTGEDVSNMTDEEFAQFKKAHWKQQQKR